MTPSQKMTSMMKIQLTREQNNYRIMKNYQEITRKTNTI